MIDEKIVYVKHKFRNFRTRQCHQGQASVGKCIPGASGRAVRCASPFQCDGEWLGTGAVGCQRNAADSGIPPHNTCNVELQEIGEILVTLNNLAYRKTLYPAV